MKLRNINGKFIYKNVASKRIDWGKKSRSNIQFDVKSLLRSIWKNDVVYEEFPVYGTRLSLDFYNANLDIAIEVQGRQHTEYVPFFHGKNQACFIDQLKRDRDKQHFCEINDIKLILIMEEEKKKISLEFLEGLINEE
jgi:hypothetical protein